jgi:parvulin-like peptidyl-prolyl isomerase
MNDDRLKQVLQEADRLAGPAKPAAVDVGAIRRRAGMRRTAWRIGSGAVTAAAAIGICIWLGQPSERQPESQAVPVADVQRIAQLEAEVRELRASTEMALRVLQEVAEQQQRDRRIAEMKKELAGIPDPMVQVRQQVNQTAERMVREGDRIWLERRQRQTAITRYQRVIELFPDNEWATVARQRLTQITETKLKGEGI